MNYRKFGNTDMEVSEIGFGAWAIGGNAMIGKTPIGWGKADDPTSLDAIHAAVDAGINFFDTADIYGVGHSETLLGEALKGTDVIVATKVGNVSRNDQFTVDYSKEYILRACEESLRRLQRGHIDYYQLHSARMVHLQQGDCIEAMQRLQDQGKVRYWGISLNTFHPDAEAEYLMQNKLGSGFQLVFNIINQRALELIRKAASNGYGVIARMPLQFGLLTGKFGTDAKFSRDDHRNVRLTGEVLDASIKVLDKEVWPLATAENISKTSLALSFILGIQGVSTAIPGIRTREHVIQNTMDLKQLSGAAMEALIHIGRTKMVSLMELMEKTG